MSGRYWDRTSDPFHVKEVRYRCANRPWGSRCYPVHCIRVKSTSEIILHALDVILAEVRPSLNLDEYEFLVRCVLDTV